MFVYFHIFSYMFLYFPILLKSLKTMPRLEVIIPRVVLQVRGAEDCEVVAWSRDTPKRLKTLRGVLSLKKGLFKAVLRLLKGLF